MTINERMFIMMEQKGLKDVELAKYLDKNTSSIATWKKKGTNPPIEYTIRIAEFLGVSVHYLLTGEESPGMTQEDQKLIAAFRSADPGTQSSIRKLLDIPEKEKLLISGNGKKIS